jgi:hypothetical protein
VAWLGVFQPQKNLPALAAIARALPDVEFRIGGKNEVAMKDPATLEALRALEAMPNVRFMGYLRRTEVPAFWPAPRCCSAHRITRDFPTPFWKPGPWARRWWRPWGWTLTG